MEVAPLQQEVQQSETFGEGETTPQSQESMLEVVETLKFGEEETIPQSQDAIEAVDTLEFGDGETLPQSQEPTPEVISANLESQC